MWIDRNKTEGHTFESWERHSIICLLSSLRFEHMTLIVLLIMLREKVFWVSWISWRYFRLKLETLEKMDAWKFERKPLGMTLCWRHRLTSQNKTTQMRPNQSRAILIFPITPTTTWLFAGYPYTTGTQKAAKISNKNSFFNWVHSLHTELMNASHSTNLFTNSCNHISTNGNALLHSHINHNNPQFLYSLWRRANARNVSFLNLSRW